MFRILDRPSRLCDGISRRELMRVGGLGALGVSLPQLLHARSVPTAEPCRGARRAKSVILFWLLGGPPQHETWDPKPEAPSGIRGEFGRIATRVPGFGVGELMPRTALLTDRIAALRAVVSSDNAHSSSGYQMLTGVPHQPLNRENVTAKAPNLWPSTAALVRRLQPDDGLPSAITLPRHIANDGEIVWPGQDAGVLGRSYDPWLLTIDPSAETFKVPNLTLPQDVSSQRMNRRRRLLTWMDAAQRHIDTSGLADRYSRHTQQAFDLLTRDRARRAFRLAEESDTTRDRYGRTRFGQSTLLARRLVEAGATLVQVNWTRVAGAPNNGTWDIHATHTESLRTVLMPMMDQTFSALLEDLSVRGLLEETLVVWIGEFGHTPKINARAGRDHWGHCFSIAMAGGGIRGGVVHGASDAHAAFPMSGRVEPADVTATIFHNLGFDPETIVHDQLGRPFPLSRGRVISEIL